LAGLRSEFNGLNAGAFYTLFVDLIMSGSTLIPGASAINIIDMDSPI
jgi:hypothetical protein